MRHVLAFLILLWAATSSAVSTAVTYQGLLRDAGQPADGVYDFQFQLKTSGGSNVGAAITVEDVPVTAGTFTVQLDFGASAFPGADRRLGIAVRPGASAGAFTPLSPDTNLLATPYALYANQAGQADIANDVIDDAINEIDIATAAVSARNIAANAVGSSEIATDAVTASEIAAGAVGTSELADLSVATADLANNSVTIAKLVGADYTSPANMNLSVPASTCQQFDLPVGGGFEPGDVVILNILNAMPSNVMLHVLRVVSTNTVRMRACNMGFTNQSFSNLQIRMISIR